MKKIPAITKTVVVSPEKVIFEKGDMVQIWDLSYLMSAKLSENHAFPVWQTLNWEYRLSRGSIVKIIELDLKVPEMAYKLNGYETDADENRVYLDTLIQDTEGNYYLTQLRFLREL